MNFSDAYSEKRNNPYYYKSLLEYPEEIPSIYENQIDLDIVRTFPYDEFYQVDNGSNLKKVKRILVAYSRRNVSIGYCQGFNFIAARIYKFIQNEENSFWLFVQLIENILPFNYYYELTGVIVDTIIIKNMIMRYFQSSFLNISENQTSSLYENSLSNILNKWLITLFIHNINEDLCEFIWNCLFLQGNIMIFKISLGLFSTLRKEILKLKSIEEFDYLLEKYIATIDEKTILVWYCFLRKYEYDTNSIKGFRNEYILKYIDSNENKPIKKSNEYIKLYKNMKTKGGTDYFHIDKIKKCHILFPICIDSMKNSRKIDYLIYKRGDKINIIENYFFSYNHIRYKSKSLVKIRKTCQNEYRPHTKSPIKVRWIDNKEQFKYNSFMSMLIERKEHFCCDYEFSRNDSFICKIKCSNNIKRQVYEYNLG